MLMQINKCNLSKKLFKNCILEEFSLVTLGDVHTECVFCIPLCCFYIVFNVSTRKIDIDCCARICNAVLKMQLLKKHVSMPCVSFCVNGPIYLQKPRSVAWDKCQLYSLVVIQKYLTDQSESSFLESHVIGYDNRHLAMTYETNALLY